MRCGCPRAAAGVRSHQDTAKSINIGPRSPCPIRASWYPRGIPRSRRAVSHLLIDAQCLLSSRSSCSCMEVIVEV